MIIKTRCKKCGITVRLDFGTLNKEEAMALAERMDEQPRECLGGHVEFGGWKTLWNLDETIHRGYDLGEIEEPTEVEGDWEFVRKLIMEGKTILDGGCNTVPDLKLPGLHEQDGLTHIGFGNFRNESHVFLRLDSPSGHRFYERVPITVKQSIPA